VELQKLIKEPLPVLTKAFAASLRAKARQQAVLLLFDTYEKVLQDNDRWLWHWLLANSQLQDLAVRLVITGRNEILKQEGWRKLQQDRGFIYTKGVERFNPDRTKAYLWNIGIRQVEYFDRIYQITKGWPYYLNIIRERLADGQDIESILKQIDRGIEELLLQESDVDKKRLMSQASRIAACCQSFDRGLIKYLLAKLELSLTVDGIDCYDWLTAQHFFEPEQSRLDDVARDVFRKSLWREDRQLFLQVHCWLADYFKTRSDRYASPDSSYADKYENADWLTARSEYLYHRMFAERVDTREFIGYLLEGLYFRENKLAQFSLQGILAESDLDKHPFLSAQGRQFLIKIKPAIVNPWAVLEESPIDYDYNKSQWNLSEAETDEAVKVCLDTPAQGSGLAEFMRLYCKSKRCPASGRLDLLMQAQKQAEKFTTDSESVNFICDLLWNKVANSLYKIGAYEEEIAAYDRALEIKPDKDVAFYNKGIALIRLGRYEEAIVAADCASEIKPDSYEAFDIKGCALSRLYRYEEAIVTYERASEIKPDSYEAFYNKGISLSWLGRYEEAIVAYERASEIKPDSYEAFCYKGVSLSWLGRYEEAIVAFDWAIKIKPDSYEAFYSKSCVLALTGEIELAITALRTSISIEPENRELAKTDPDFDAIRNDERFQQLIAEPNTQT
jgi:tetratricopeptide (TPR) repeat protein